MTRSEHRHCRELRMPESFCAALAALAIYCWALPSVARADSFQDELVVFEGQPLMEVGRDAKVAAYEKLIKHYPDHPDRAKAMLQLASVWQCKVFEQEIAPDHKEAIRWLREARATAPQGSKNWCEAMLRLADELQPDRREEGRRVLQELIEHALDSNVEVHGLYALQLLEQGAKRLDEAERICIQIQDWLSDPAHLPKGMLEKGETFRWMQNSARAMMFAWAEMHDVPKVHRAAKIAGLVQRFPHRRMAEYEEQALKHMQLLLDAPVTIGGDARGC